MQKIAVFTYRSPHLCFPWRRPCDYHAVCCMVGKTCQTPRSMYLSILNSFRVLRCLSQCISPKIAMLPHFCFPWGRRWGNHAKCCMDKENSMLTNCVVACVHLAITVCEIERDIGRKSSFFHTPLHSTPQLGGFPSD